MGLLHGLYASSKGKEAFQKSLSLKYMIDTHCHLDLIEAEGIPVAQALKNAEEQGVSHILQIATNLSSSFGNRERFGANAPETKINIYWTVGLHPCEVQSHAKEERQQILELGQASRRSEGFVGLGETGLDYFHNTESKQRQAQKDSLIEHARLAQQLGCPLVLHVRDGRNYSPECCQAILDAFDILKDTKAQGVLHCFSYTHKEALPFVEELGYFVSYSGILSFPNAKNVQEGATKLPLNCLLVETDAPYLAPVPYRGKVNQPAYVKHTLEYLIRLRAKECGEAPQLIREQIYQNSLRFLGIG